MGALRMLGGTLTDASHLHKGLPVQFTYGETDALSDGTHGSAVPGPLTPMSPNHPQPGTDPDNCWSDVRAQRGMRASSALSSPHFCKDLNIDHLAWWQVRLGSGITHRRGPRGWHC